MKRSGAIPCQIIEQFIDTGRIRAESPVPVENVQPASLDLRLGTRGFRVRAAFLPRRGESIEDALSQYRAEALEMDKGAVLEVGQTYVFELLEQFHLPPDVHAYTNNKSSTGRMNIWVRALVDGLPRFDRIPVGYEGRAYVMVTPRSWPIKVATGVCLNQARFLIGDNRLNDLELEMAQQKIGLVYNRTGELVEPELDRGVLLTADLSQDIVGYVARECSRMVDLTTRAPHPAAEFFEPIRAEGGEVLLRQGSFYILSTCEYLRVPPMFAVEMVAYDIHSGEYRSHYAGFFDPGFGYGRDGEVKGTPAVLEVDPHEDVVFRHGQPICKMVYEYLIKEPDKVYGSELSSHYQHQRGPQLGRHFQ